MISYLEQYEIAQDLVKFLQEGRNTMPSIADRKRAFEEGPTRSEPFDVWPNDKDNMPPLPFPYLEGSTPAGWTLFKIYNISAISMAEFIRNIKVGCGYAFIADELIGEYNPCPLKIG